MATVHVDSSLPLHPLTVENYVAMWEAGILTAEDRVELLDGVIVAMAEPSERHSHAVIELNMLAVPAAAAAGLRVPVQDALGVASPFSLPQPDLSVVPPGTSTDRVRDAVLVVEVSVTSLRTDLGRKAAIYAASGIPEYWVLDVDRREMVVHRKPGPNGYRDVRRATEHQTIDALHFDLRIAVSALL